MDIKIFSSQSFLMRLSDFVLCLLIKGLSNLSLCQSFAIEEEKLYLNFDWQLIERYSSLKLSYFF